MCFMKMPKMSAPPVAPPTPAPLPPANPPAVGKLQRKSSDEMTNRSGSYRRGKQALTIPVGGVGSTGTGVGY
jgi:hypothetical protein